MEEPESFMKLRDSDVIPRDPVDMRILWEMSPSTKVLGKNPSDYKDAKSVNDFVFVRRVYKDVYTQVDGHSQPLTIDKGKDLWGVDQWYEEWGPGSSTPYTDLRLGTRGTPATAEFSKRFLQQAARELMISPKLGNESFSTLLVQLGTKGPRSGNPGDAKLVTALQTLHDRIHRFFFELVNTSDFGDFVEEHKGTFRVLTNTTDDDHETFVLTCLLVAAIIRSHIITKNLKGGQDPEATRAFFTEEINREVHGYITKNLKPAYKNFKDWFPKEEEEDDEPLREAEQFRTEEAELAPTPVRGMSPTQETEPEQSFALDPVFGAAEYSEFYVPVEQVSTPPPISLYEERELPSATRAASLPFTDEDFPVTPSAPPQESEDEPSSFFLGPRKVLSSLTSVLSRTTSRVFGGGEQTPVVVAEPVIEEDLVAIMMGETGTVSRASKPIEQVQPIATASTSEEDLVAIMMGETGTVSRAQQPESDADLVAIMMGETGIVSRAQQPALEGDVDFDAIMNEMARQSKHNKEGGAESAEDGDGEDMTGLAEVEERTVIKGGRTGWFGIYAPLHAQHNKLLTSYDFGGEVWNAGIKEIATWAGAGFVAGAQNEMRDVPDDQLLPLFLVISHRLRQLASHPVLYCADPDSVGLKSFVAKLNKVSEVRTQVDPSAQFMVHLERITDTSAHQWAGVIRTAVFWLDDVEGDARSYRNAIHHAAQQGIDGGTVTIVLLVGSGLGQGGDDESPNVYAPIEAKIIATIEDRKAGDHVILVPEVLMRNEIEENLFFLEAFALLNTASQLDPFVAVHTAKKLAEEGGRYFADKTNMNNFIQGLFVTKGSETASRAAFIAQTLGRFDAQFHAILEHQV